MLARDWLFPISRRLQRQIVPCADSRLGKFLLLFIRGATCYSKVAREAFNAKWFCTALL